MRIKRAIITIIAIVMSITVLSLAGCSKQESTGNTEEKVVNNNNEVKTSDKKVVEQKEEVVDATSTPEAEEIKDEPINSSMAPMDSSINNEIVQVEDDINNSMISVDSVNTEVIEETVEDNSKQGDRVTVQSNDGWR